MSEQSENLERVSERIAALVVEFCSRALESGQPQFHMEELTLYVYEKVKVSAPDSAGRILRDLRQRGVLNYRVLSRSKSLYEVLAKDTEKTDEAVQADPSA